jgi:hypothetical protein
MAIPAVHYAKISRFDSNGNDITDYLSQLETFFISSPDTGQLQYNIISTQAQSTYFIYRVEPVYVTSSYYEILDYTLYGAYKGLFTIPPGNSDGINVNSYVSTISNPNGYFTASSGIYDFYNTPNIFLTASFTASISMSAGTFCDTDSGIFVYVDRPDGIILSKKLWDLTGFSSSSYINISASVPLRFTQTGNPFPYSASIIENSNLYVKIINADPGGPSGGNLSVRDFYFNITQSNPPQPSGNPIVVFSPDQVDFFYSDYNSIYGNASDNETSTYIMDVDYSGNPLVPINFDQLISLTATKAQVQDSNYASQTWSNIRYNGNKSIAQFSPLNDGFNSPSELPQPNQLDSGYGILSPAEKNEAYFAYFEGIGGTGPEIIDQTAYFVKWIIDEAGNIEDPEPRYNPYNGLQQNNGVLNLLNTFEPGNNRYAVVSLVSNDPTLTTNPNDDALVGTHPITHVGRIANILMTETGSASNDYLRTMSFASTGIGLTSAVNYNFYASLTTNVINRAANTPINGLSFTTVLSNPGGYFNNNDIYTVPANSIPNSTQVQFKFRTQVRNRDSADNTWTFTFLKSTDGGANYYPIEVQGRWKKPNVTPPIVNGTAVIWYDPTYYNGNNGWGFYGLEVAPPNNAYGSIGDLIEVEMFTPPLDVQIGDKYKVYVNSSRNYDMYGLAGDTNTYFGATMTYNPNLEATSSYWRVGTYHPASSNTLTVLTASNQLTQVYNNATTYYQNVYTSITNGDVLEYSSSILDWGFNKPTIPFSANADKGGPLPGDYIRFEYNPNQVYNIKKIGTVTNPSSIYFGNLTLSVFPPVPATANLNHFNIYRIINDGTYVILNVPKPEEGNSFTGLLYPQFLSDKLSASSSIIVQDLIAKGVIS